MYGQVQDGHVVPPAAAAQRVEGGPYALPCPTSRSLRRATAGASGRRRSRPRARRRAAARAASARCSRGSRGRGTSRPRASRRRSRRPPPAAPTRTCSSQSGRQSPRGRPNSSPAIVPPGRTTRAELAQRRRRVVDVAQQVGEGQRVELAVGERQRARRSPRRARPGRSSRRRASASISGALVDADDGAALLPHELARDRAGAGRDVEDAVAGPGLDPRDEEAPPARVLAVGEERRRSGRRSGRAARTASVRARCDPRRRV